MIKNAQMLGNLIIFASDPMGIVRLDKILYAYPTASGITVKMEGGNTCTLTKNEFDKMAKLVDERGGMVVW